MRELTRRGMLGGFVTGVAASLPILHVGCAEGSKPETAVAPPPPAKKQLKACKNEDFYGADGKFDAAKAKAAYYELMEYHSFPVFPRLKTDEFWTLDFGLGKFTEVGMGGIFYINNQRDNYLLHDIWLLPGQMIPEHWHVKHEDTAPKMEAWLVRNGMAYMYAEGDESPGVADKIPPSHKDCIVARAETEVKPGEVVRLEKAEKKHWMLAGPEGAIVTEVATYHEMKALRFSHPDIKL